MAKNVSIEHLGSVIKKNVEAELELEYKAYAFDLFSEIVKRTPVDTGRARSNWTIDINSPDYSTTDSTTAAEPSNINTEGFPDVFISSGLSYVSELDKGRSKQAPTGIIEPSIVAVDVKRGR